MATATKVNISPLEDRIVVQPGEGEQVTASGIVIPDTAKEKPQEGIVLAVGAGRWDDEGKRIPLDVKVGDTSSTASTAAPRSSTTARSTSCSPPATCSRSSRSSRRAVSRLTPPVQLRTARATWAYQFHLNCMPGALRSGASP